MYFCNGKAEFSASLLQPSGFIITDADLVLKKHFLLLLLMIRTVVLLNIFYGNHGTFF